MSATNALNGVMSPPPSIHGNGANADRPAHHKSDGPKRKNGKTTRVRTVLNEKQLHTLRTCYAANCRPDALMKEQLTEMTGLSSRVIRVWFQNKRCKDKKRSIALKQIQEQQQQSTQQQHQNNGDQVIENIEADYIKINLVVYSILVRQHSVVVILRLSI